MSKKMTLADLEKAMKHSPKEIKSQLVKTNKESLIRNREIDAARKAQNKKPPEPKFAFRVHAMELKKDNKYGKCGESFGTNKIDEAVKQVRALADKDSVREILIHVRQ